MKNLHTQRSGISNALFAACFLATTVAFASPQTEEDPKPESPPAEYKSTAAESWGKTKVEDEKAEEKAPEKDADAETKAAPEAAPTTPPAPSTGAPSKEDCDRLKKEGKEIPEGCKAADMGIVFQGGIKQSKATQVKPVEQAKDTESETLHERIIQFDKSKVTPREKRIRLWQVASKEPDLFSDEPAGFTTAGLQVGYSSIIQRASEVKDAFNPVIHVAAEVGYQLFPMFQLALVGEFEYMSGSTATGKEVVQAGLEYEDGSGVPRDPRDVGAFLDSYIGIGVRPTMRFNVNLRNFQLLAGAGLGWHFFHTSGEWRTKLPTDDRANQVPIDEQARWTGGDQAFYSFETSDSGIYYVFEMAAMYRLFQQRLGAGLFLKYSVPIHGAVEPDVTVDKSYDVAGDWSGYSAQENDYGDTFIRHLSSMSLVTFGFTADFRF